MVLECLVCVSSPQTLMEDEPEKYQSHFSEYIKREIDADCMEALYKKVHAAIRADPTTKKSEKQPPKEHKRLVAILLNTIMLILICVYIFNQCIYCNHQHDFALCISLVQLLMPFLHGATGLHIFISIDFVGVFRYNLKKLTYEERKEKLVERLNTFNSAADDEDDE